MNLTDPRPATHTARRPNPNPDSFVTTTGHETDRDEPAMPIRACEWCSTPIYPATTGRPIRFCDSTCRQAARRADLLAASYPYAWQRRALAEGWRPPDRPR
jgi:hypothetical protein